MATLTRTQHDFCCELAQTINEDTLKQAFGYKTKGAVRNQVYILAKKFDVPTTGDYYSIRCDLQAELRRRGYKDQASSMSFEDQRRFTVLPRRD